MGKLRGATKTAKILSFVSFHSPRATQSPILLSPHLGARKASRWSTKEESEPRQPPHEVTSPVGGDA